MTVTGSGKDLMQPSLKTLSRAGSPCPKSGLFRPAFFFGIALRLNPYISGYIYLYLELPALNNSDPLLKRAGGYLIELILLLLTASPGMGQTLTEPSRLKQFNITINYNDYTVKTQMLNQDKKISPENEKTYMWYDSRKIMETKGGYDGKLIHGSFKAFYLNNQLKEKGSIRYGLKHKEWKYWYPDGTLREVINWKNGVKWGPYYLYNDQGSLMAKGNFKNDKLEGDFFTYGPGGKVIEKKYYKDGEEIPEKARPAKKRLFKRKDHQTKNKPSFFDRMFKRKKTSEKPSSQPEKKKKVET